MRRTIGTSLVTRTPRALSQTLHVNGRIASAQDACGEEKREDKSIEIKSTALKMVHRAAPCKDCVSMLETSIKAGVPAVLILDCRQTQEFNSNTSIVSVFHFIPKCSSSFSSLPFLLVWRPLWPQRCHPKQSLLALSRKAPSQMQPMD